MHRSSFLTAIALAVVVGATGCASSDDDTTASAPPAASQPAAKQPASADRLDAADAAVLRSARQTAARYCAGHKATAGELTAAVATLESLYEIDPEAQGSGGATVEQVTVALQRKLRACGARTAARRLAKLTG
jgi:hypothetical protein